MMNALRRALVVDDDAAIRILVARILTRHGFVVDKASDGAEAIEKLAETDYAIITLDLMMPRIDGIAVIRHLIEHQPGVLAKVVVMTAFGSSGVRHLCPPGVRFIEKPFEIERLLRYASELSPGE